MSSTTAYDYVQRAERKREQGDYRGAIADYDESLRIEPDDPMTFHERGLAKRQLKDYRGAIADYTEALRIKPDNAVAFHERGFAKYYLKDYRGAIADYDEALRIKPDDPMTFHNRGYAKKELGDYRGAIADYDEALRIKPDYHQAFNERGLAKKRLKDYRGAIADYDEALRIKPDYAVAFNNRGVAKKELGDYRGAIADYDEALRIKPDYHQAFHNRGVAKDELKDYRGAIADYDEALRIKPDYELAFNNRGFAKHNLGDYRGAIADYDEALRIKPNYARCFQHRGSAKKELGDLSGAFEDYTQALRLYPAAIAKGEYKGEERLREAEAEFAELKRERRAAAERKAAEDQRQVKEARRHLEAKRRGEAERRVREEKERREREEAERRRIEAERRAAAEREERIACERRIPANIFAAVKSGNLEPLTILLREGYDFKITDDSGNNLLHTAILAEKTEVALWLIENASLDLDAVSEAEDRTALHYAAFKGNLRVVEALVDKGVNVFAEDGFDQTARALAIENKYLLIATLLKREMKKGRAASGTPSTPSGGSSGGLLPPTPSGGAGAALPESERRPDGKLGVDLHVDHRELVYEREIGVGGFGEVFEGKWQGRPVAIKKLINQRLSQKAIRSFTEEATKMAQVTLGDIENKTVHFHRICVEPEHFSLVMELMPQGNLAELLEARGQELPWEIRWTIAQDVAQGLALIHSLNILHCDLKSPNVLLDDRLRAKISDFGLAKMKKDVGSSSATSAAGKKTVSVGTWQWKAPELLKIGPKYSRKSDVYAYGMVLWEIAACELPYSGEDYSVIKGEVKSGERAEIPEDTPQEFAELIARCWAQDPKDRPDSARIVLKLKALYERGFFTKEGGGGGGAAAAGVSVVPASTGEGYVPM